MKRQSISSYFYFGTCMRYLQDAPVGHKIKGKGFILGNIGNFLTSLNALSLEVTCRTSAYDDLVAFSKELEKVTDKDAELSADQSSKLIELITDIRKTLAAELLGYEAFIVTPKILDTKKLLDDVASLFAPNMFSTLPDITQYDFTEAGKCIAFERPTAAAYHLLRGTEAVLRFFYCTLVHQKRVSPLMWGNMVIDLRNRQKTKKHATLYNNLENI